MSGNQLIFWREGVRDRVEIGIVLAMVAMVGFVIYMVGSTGSVISHVEEVSREGLPLFGGAWEVRYLDEVLTHSASRYADVPTSERAELKMRYDRAALRLAEILEMASQNANPQDLEHIQRVSEANDTLVELEARVFELTNQGHEIDARKIIGHEYAKQKALYTEGIDAYYFAQAQRLKTRVAGVSSKAQDHRIAVMIILSVIGGILIYLGRINQIQRQGNAKRDTERDVIAESLRRQSRVHQGLEMSLNEKQALSTLEDSLAEELPSWSTELLLADSKNAHLRQALSTDHNKHGPGCDVATPDLCPAIRRGTSLIFEDPNGYDACPHLRERRLDGGTAVCLPLNVMGQSIGVAHSVNRSDTGAIELDRIRQIVQLGVDRIGVLRAFATTKRHASRDPLTGLLNRRSLEDSVRHIETRGVPYVVAFCDLDHFKILNDTHGHSEGDRALRLFSRALRGVVRPTDLVARWGGEEFVLVFPEMDIADAVGVLERVRVALADSLKNANHPPFTFSAGVGDGDSDSFHDAVKTADLALLDAKRSGRDRIVTSSTLEKGASALPQAL